MIGSLARFVGLILVAIGFAIGTPNAARATLVTLDFEEFNGTYFKNLSSHGFRISPTCHVDAIERLPNSTIAIGGDPAGCSNPNTRNANYLGPVDTPAGGNWVYFDYGEHPFSFKSFDWYGMGVHIISSRGGEIDMPFLGEMWSIAHVTLSGPDWEGVKWILASLNGPGDPAMFLDNMVFRVPTGETLPLLIISMTALVAVRRKHSGLRTSVVAGNR